ncbi:hypothetical protein FQN57_003316 [Myotisia sp. PD_48]|nr:hypothetical protein FQN57_003316 [Myotisia sp. PD_48]
MPMRWTPENDQLLLLKIIETHELSVNAASVAAAWPGTDGDAKPTARAISERIGKIRSMAKTNGKIAAGSAPATPVSRKRGPAAGSKSSGKRARTSNTQADPTTPTRNPIKTEGNGVLDGGITHQVLAKPVRKTQVVSYKIDTDDEDVKYESEASEFSACSTQTSSVSFKKEEYV